MDQMVNLKNLSTGILIFPDSKVKVTTSNHSGAKGLLFSIQKQYFIVQEGGTKEFFEIQPLPFNLCAKYCHITPLL